MAKNKKTRSTIKNMNPDDLIIVGLDTEDDESHPLYDERIYKPIDDSYVRNIKFYGVLQPVTVRKDGDKVFVVDGRRRVRAARLARKFQEEAGEVLMKVPVTEHGTAGDDKHLAGVMISTNEQREDDSILKRAMKAARMKNLGADMDEISTSFGRTEQTIKIWLNLLEADPRLHDAVEEGFISFTGIKELLSFPKDEQWRIFQTLYKQSGETKVTQAAIIGFKKSIGASNRSDVETMSEEELTQAMAELGGEPNSEDVLNTTLDLSDSVSKPSGKRRPRNQSGVKRTWLRKALDTEAGKSLDDEKFGVLTWIAHGTGDTGWWTEFESAANAELDAE